MVLAKYRQGLPSGRAHHPISGNRPFLSRTTDFLNTFIHKRSNFIQNFIILLVFFLDIFFLRNLVIRLVPHQTLRRSHRIIIIFLLNQSSYPVVLNLSLFIIKNVQNIARRDHENSGDILMVFVVFRQQLNFVRILLDPVDTSKVLFSIRVAPVVFIVDN